MNLSLNEKLALAMLLSIALTLLVDVVLHFW